MGAPPPVPRPPSPGVRHASHCGSHFVGYIGGRGYLHGAAHSDQDWAVVGSNRVHREKGKAETVEDAGGVQWNGHRREGGEGWRPVWVVFDMTRVDFAKKVLFIVV